MNGIIRYIIGVSALLTVLCLAGCADETLTESPKGEGTLLNMYASVNTANTRLAELGDAGNMFTDAKGKKNIGLYIYYEDDYKADDLSKPYIRNLECTYEGGKIIPTNKENIYIYDRMTIVAFYPYNASMSDEANYFTVKTDEKAYPISESDYSKQLYIPYRAQTNVNPTNAYMINLGFGPQQTCKVEVVLVADALADFPESKNLTDGKIKLLPTVDRYEDGNTAWDSDKGDLRENWLDAIKDFPADDEYNQGTPTGGKYVRRYTAYVWKSGAGDKHHDPAHKHDNNILPKGEVLFESDKLILRVPAQVNLNEKIVYRYGYNMNTGEIFIPTSDKLVYDAASLQGVKFDNDRAYQVCDIDLGSIANWAPKTAFKGTYDGGGHKIENLKYNTIATQTGNKALKQSFGLFSQITSESTLMNIELVNPMITVDFSSTALKDTCYVGTLCGLVNPELSEDEKRKMVSDGLPPELSGPVREALIQERLKDFAPSTCYIRGCKVTDPAITVTGENVRVGGLCGGAGNQKQKAEIKDSYVWQSDNTTYQGILVNAADADKSKYSNAFVAGFCGILANSGKNGGIKNCYTTLQKVQAFVKDATANKDIATGFYHPATGKELLGTVTVSGCYTLKADANPGVTSFADGRPTDWPLFENDNTVTNGGGMDYLQQGGSYPAYKWTDSWKDMNGNNSYPSLIWETRLLKPLN